MELFQKYKIIKENQSKNLVDHFHASLTQKQKALYAKRDNCGPAVLDFLDHAKNPELKRVRGYFKADKVVSEKNDFTTGMKKEFNDSGLNFDNPKHREDWINKSKYAEDWKSIPHYWAKHSNGDIHDPSGHAQFVKSGYAADLNPERYTENPHA